MRKHWIWMAIAVIGVLAWSQVAGAAILGSHSFSWWDDPVGGVIVTPLGGPAPGPGAVRLVDVNEWHLDQAQTAQWYMGGAVAGLPANPFNPLNRTGVTAGSVIPGVANSEAFVYEIANVNFGSGNGFTFSGGNPGVNDLSGINVTDMFGALNITAPFPGSQFMFTPGQLGSILDLTPGYAPAAQQDWAFNAFAGAGNFEWDIPNWPGPADPIPAIPPPVVRPGVLAGTSAVFGYAMPGNWLDAVDSGWIHSWDFVQPNPSFQVNVIPTVPGFSGPMAIPEPGSLALLAVGGLWVGAARRRSRRTT